jgi:hypothetical protein
MFQRVLGMIKIFFDTAWMRKKNHFFYLCKKGFVIRIKIIQETILSKL